MPVSLFLNNTFIKNNNSAALLDGTKSMGYLYRGLSLNGLSNCPDNKFLALRVQGTGCLVKNDHTRIFIESSCDVNSLPLSSREFLSFVSNILFWLHWKAIHKVLNMTHGYRAIIFILIERIIKNNIVFYAVAE